MGIIRETVRELTGKKETKNSHWFMEGLQDIPKNPKKKKFIPEQKLKYGIIRKNYEGKETYLIHSPKLYVGKNTSGYGKYKKKPYYVFYDNDELKNFKSEKEANEFYKKIKDRNRIYINKYFKEHP